MPIQLKMPALSPTMEEGTLGKWLVSEGDTVSSGDLLAEIETDKATMDIEAVEEGVITKIMVSEGTEGVKVGAVIAIIRHADETEAEISLFTPAEVAPPSTADDAAPPSVDADADDRARSVSGNEPSSRPAQVANGAAKAVPAGRLRVSPLARRIAVERGIDLAGIGGSGPAGRIVKADIDAIEDGANPEKRGVATPVTLRSTSVNVDASPPAPILDTGIPHDVVELSNMRKTIVRKLAESKQQVPHIYLSIDIRLDALLRLRAELNASLAIRGVKLSINDMLIKALALALIDVPQCNVRFMGDSLLRYRRADISVAVSLPTGLITPIVSDAAIRSLSAISIEVKTLAARARDGKLQPHEFQGGTASISNMGMMGVKHFGAIINAPQAMILAIGAVEKRPFIVDDALAIATVMTATGSFDHRVIDGADGAQLMNVLRQYVEEPLRLVA